jgi:hypothetical protein
MHSFVHEEAARRPPPEALPATLCARWPAGNLAILWHPFGCRVNGVAWVSRTNLAIRERLWLVRLDQLQVPLSSLSRRGRRQPV